MQTVQSKADDAYNYAEQNYSILDDIVDDVNDIENIAEDNKNIIDCMDRWGSDDLDYCL